MEGWENNIYYMHAVEYYSAWRRKEILMYVTTWTNLEDIMLIK